MAPLSWIPLAILATIPIGFAAPAEVRAIGICDSATLESTATSYRYAVGEGDRRYIDGILAPYAPYTPAPYTQNGQQLPITGYRAIFNTAREIQEATVAINLNECSSDSHLVTENSDEGKIDIQTKIFHSPKNLTVIGVETTFTKII
ncbi:hypothetical protein K491DRAFT_723723 [Lophiostoma macrostomum CBS 122681]|uniref:Uncharacterized protein n=1 Tax=Lophiostoma macrostomum CBS 122681 TaxID=1314788 RepID=A0A6A6SL23_9PLEO|nr:hypothetical protein K491DRAFT_723723 [Lophiostoma macrostomum CBS 122681]